MDRGYHESEHCILTFPVTRASKKTRVVVGVTTLSVSCGTLLLHNHIVYIIMPLNTSIRNYVLRLSISISIWLDNNKNQKQKQELDEDRRRTIERHNEVLRRASAPARTATAATSAISAMSATAPAALAASATTVGGTAEN